MAIGDPYSPHRQFMGVCIPLPLLAYPKISLQAKVVLARLWLYCGSKSSCWPHQGTLAKDLGVSERSIRNYLDELIADRFITSQKIEVGGTNQYIVIEHPILGFQDDSDNPEFNNPEPDLPPEEFAGQSGKACRSTRQDVPVHIKSIGSNEWNSLKGKDSPAKTTAPTTKDKPENQSKNNYTPPPPAEHLMSDVEEYCTLQLAVSKFRRGKGFKKPPKAQVDIAERSWPEITEAEVDASLAAFADCEDLRKKGYPFLAWAKNPLNWLPKEFADPQAVAPQVKRTAPRGEERLPPLPEVYLELNQAALRIREQHPSHARCGLPVVTALLKAILATVAERERPALLAIVEQRHKGWCKSEDWAKDRGRWVPQLAKYLELGGKEQWANDPPPAEDAYEDPYIDSEVFERQQAEYKILHAHRKKRGEPFRPGWMAEERALVAQELGDKIQ